MPSPSAGTRSGMAAGMVGTAGMAALAAARFLPHQTLWIDEVTQMAGLGLGPIGVVRWLLHPTLTDLGVPSDRMPPLSYWLGWLWAQAFGLHESSLRWFGVACVVAAVALTFSAARRAFGPLAAWGAGLCLALSPNVCTTAVEIRAYPLFLLISAGALRSAVGIACAETSQRTIAWLGLGAWLLLGLFTHFFGVVLAAAMLVGLAAHRLYLRRPLAPLAILGAALALAAVGLVPFAKASAEISAVSERNRVYEVVQLLYRLVAHPAMATHRVVALVALAAAAALAIAVAFPGASFAGGTFQCPGGPPGHCKGSSSSSHTKQQQQQQQQQQQKQCLIVLAILQPANC